jgi:hypothetical protein
MCLDSMMVVEIFAGTARLNRAARDMGLNGLAVDKDSNRRQNVHIVNYDLNDPAQFSALCELVQKQHAQILWVHLAPACGTASRARNGMLICVLPTHLEAAHPIFLCRRLASIARDRALAFGATETFTWKSKQTINSALYPLDVFTPRSKVSTLGIGVWPNGPFQPQMGLLMQPFYKVSQRVPRLYIDSFMGGLFESMKIMK